MAGVVPTYKQSIAPDRVHFVIDVNGTTADKPLKSDVAVPLSGELSGKTSEKMPEKTPEKILCLISKNPRITTCELVDIIGIHERNVARNIKTLQERGLLRRVYWSFRYGFTNRDYRSFGSISTMYALHV